MYVNVGLPRSVFVSRTLTDTCRCECLRVCEGCIDSVSASAGYNGLKPDLCSYARRFACYCDVCDFSNKLLGVFLGL